MCQRVGVCLSLHSLAVCDWAHMPAVFLWLSFHARTLFEYNKVPLPYLKVTGQKNKIGWNYILKDSVTQKLWVEEQF